FVCDGEDCCLHGRKPDRECASIVLRQDAEKTFDRSEQRAMHHQRAMLLAVFSDIFELESAWQREIELHRGKLPQPADGIHQFHVDLWTVESRFIGNHGGMDAETIAGLAQRALGKLPVGRLAVVLAAGTVVPGRYLSFVFSEAEGVQSVGGE